MELAQSVQFTMWACSCEACSLRGDTVVVTRIYGSAVTLLLCSQPLPEAANGFAH